MFLTIYFIYLHYYLIQSLYGFDSFCYFFLLHYINAQKPINDIITEGEIGHHHKNINFYFVLTLYFIYLHHYFNICWLDQLLLIYINIHDQIDKHTHTDKYKYMHIYVCVCVFTNYKRKSNHHKIWKAYTIS